MPSGLTPTSTSGATPGRPHEEPTLDLLIDDADADRYAELIERASTGLRLHRTDTASDCDIALGQPDRVAARMRAGARFRWVQSTWAGVAPLVAADLRRDYLLTGLGGVFGAAIAEYVLAYLLHFDQQMIARQQAQQQRSWRPLLPRRLGDRRVVVLGTGSIGGAVIKTLASFGCAVTGINRTGTDPGQLAERQRVRVLPIDALRDELVRHDTLVSTLPDTAATQGLLDATVLAALPTGAVFINVGRGSVVDEAALVNVLRSGRLAAAILDVTATEPLPAAHPFWTLPQVFLTYHCAGPSRPDEIAPVFIANLERYRNGQPLLHTVDFSRGY